MRKRKLNLLHVVMILTLAVPGIGVGDDPPDESQILLEEIPELVKRSVLYSVPDADAALEALSTMPQGLENVIVMHTGRINPNSNESTPGVAPAPDLLKARIDLLLSQQHRDKKLQDTMSGEFAILLLPMDATIVIVIMPTQVVSADPAATPLPERRIDLSNVTYQINGRTRTLEQYMADGATNAISFMHNGEFIYEDFQNGFTRDTRHQMWSVTKSVTTALVGIAKGEGKIDSINDPIQKYIPDTVGTVWEGTTIEDLLQMESGIYWVDVPIHQPEELILMGIDFHTNGLYGMTRNDYLLKLTRVSKAGEYYRYNSADAQMLTWLLENVYGDSYANILSAKIWRPAGMERDALVMVDRVGDTYASMGLFATPRDMARFGDLFRNGGRDLTGEQIVPEAWVAASHNYDKANGGGPRGYMWPSFPDGGYTASGYGHQRVSVVPNFNMVGVRFGNDPVDSIAPKEWEAVYKAVARALGET